MDCIDPGGPFDRRLALQENEQLKARIEELASGAALDITTRVETRVELEREIQGAISHLSSP